MYKVRKQFHVPIGHRLSKHCGLCKNIHGHNLKIEVQLKCTELNENDMVIDFSILKKIVNEQFINGMDHACILNSKDTKTIDLIKSGSQEKDKLIVVENCDPTAEKLSEIIYHDLQKSIAKVNALIKVDYVRIWESESAVAEYSKD